VTSVAPTSGQERVIRPRRPLNLGHTLRLLQHGGADPTFKAQSGTFWLGQATPDGPSTLALWRRGDEVVGQAWGPGAAWSLAALPDLLGEGDDDSGFEERHDLVAQGRKARPGWRITRTRLVLQTLVPANIEQRVTGQEAFAGHARLVWRFGEPAPGRGSEVGLRVPPAPRDWARIPSWEWTRAGIDGQRAAAAVRDSRRPRTCRWPMRTAACGQSPVWGSGRRPRSPSGPSATRTVRASATTTSPRTSPGP
jgi:hypothetical protein